MTVEKHAEHAGLAVYFEPEECELFLKLAADAEKANEGQPTVRRYNDGSGDYLSVSLKLGRTISSLLRDNPNLLRP